MIAGDLNINSAISDEKTFDCHLIVIIWYLPVAHRGVDRGLAAKLLQH